MNRVLIVGATSAVAEATARQFAQRGAALFLVARKTTRLEDIAADLRVRGASSVTAHLMDATEFDRHRPMLDEALDRLGGLDVLLIAHGTLSDQSRCEAEPGLVESEFRTNATSVMSICLHTASIMEKQRAGTIAVISSVAGDRGRASNHVYGAAKAALNEFLSGLRQRLHPHGVRVLTIKPGFVDTPMTAGLPKGPLWAEPDAVGRDIFTAISKHRDVIYTPWFWRIIMAIVRALPTAIFLRFGPR